MPGVNSNAAARTELVREKRTRGSQDHLRRLAHGLEVAVSATIEIGALGDQSGPC